MPRLFALALLLLALCLAPFRAIADDSYPNRPIRILVPYPPGGSTDIVTRPLAEQLRVILKQAVVVENKPGAFGITATEELARSKPDGYTLLAGYVNTNSITPVLYAKKMTINYEKDVVPIMRLVEHPTFFVATAEDFPPKNLAELIAYAKERPGKVKYGSVGVGSGNHLSAAAFAKKAGVDLVHIPNKGGAAMTADLVRGDTQLVAGGVVATFSAMARAGKVRPLAVDTAQRLPEYPDVPTMKEAGYPLEIAVPWQGLFAPAGTPAPILEKVHAAVLQAMQTPELKETYAKVTTLINPTRSLAEAKDWLQNDMQLWAKLLAELKVEPEE